jgi:glycerate 2-kinase
MTAVFGRRAASDGRHESHAFLRALFDAAVSAADPARLLPGRLPPAPAGRTVVVGAGKAGASMAAAVEREWQGPLEGLVVTRYGHAVPCERIEVVEAAHPVPDAAGREVARRILELAGGLGRDDLLLCLISGGGSALLALPAAGVSLEDKQAVNKALLRSGATIAEMNCVRKHLSAIKGGRLAAAAHPARVVTFLISDVPGDDPSVIASGPTVPDPTTYNESLEVLARYRIDGPASALEHLRTGAAGAAAPAGPAGPTGALVCDAPGVDSPAASGSAPAETPKPGDPAFAADEVVMLATATDALNAAAGCARAAGVTPLLLGDDLQGEARDLGGAHAALAIACATGGETALVALREAVARGAAHVADPVFFVPQPPLVLLSGGETTVTVRGSGRGGRDTEYLLGLALALDGHPAISALAGDTDGIDGSEDSAGAFVTPDTLARCRRAGVDPVAALAANDAYGPFAALGDLVVTGPTRTNVNDFRAVQVR